MDTEEKEQRARHETMRFARALHEAYRDEMRGAGVPVPSWDALSAHERTARMEAVRTVEGWCFQALTLANAEYDPHCDC